MSFLETVDPDQAEGAVADLYASDGEVFGFLPNFTRVFSLRPEVYGAWRQLNGAIKGGMDLRRYELATLAAARRLRSSYCMLAHGKIVAEDFDGPEVVAQIAAAGTAAALDDVDRAVIELAEKVAVDATSVEEGDIERLRSLGLSDEEIFGVVLAAAARCFFSKTLDAAGVCPDARFAALEPGLRDTLVVGRPIAEG